MFLEQDLKFLGEVFALARIQTVNSQPSNRQALENLMNFEVIFKNKCVEANVQLGVVKETPPDAPKEIETNVEAVAEEEAVQG
jgi:hypothetical protein